MMRRLSYPFVLTLLATAISVAFVVIAQLGFGVSYGCQPITIGHSMIHAGCEEAADRSEPFVNPAKPVPTPTSPQQEDVISANRQSSTVGRAN